MDYFREDHIGTPVSKPVAAGPASHGRIVLLVLTAFILSLSANTVSPLLPFILKNLARPPVQLERHAAFLSGVYLLAMFLAAPLFGYFSDRLARRSILLAGIGAFVVSLFALARAASVGEIYASRIVAGIGAGGVMPVLLAHVSTHYRNGQRAQRLAWLVSAVLIGSLVGPYLAGFAARPASWEWLGPLRPASLLMAPLLAAAAASSAILCGVYLFFDARLPPKRHTRQEGDAGQAGALYTLFALSIILMYAVGSFEVGLSTTARATLRLDAAQLGMMYAECAFVMLLMQTFFFSRQFKHFASRYLVIPAISVMGIALALFPSAGTHAGLAFAVAGIAGGAGVIAPLISYRVSILAGNWQGKNFGLQSAFSSLGQAMGATGSGLLSGLDRQLPFWLAATLLVAGSLLIVARQPAPLLPEAER